MYYSYGVKSRNMQSRAHSLMLLLFSTMFPFVRHHQALGRYECGVKTKCENVWFLFLGENNIVHWRIYIYMLLGGISQSAWREKKNTKIIADPHKQSHRDYSKSHIIWKTFICIAPVNECENWCACVSVCHRIHMQPNRKLDIMRFHMRIHTHVSLHPAMCHSWWIKWSNEKE